MEEPIIIDTQLHSDEVYEPLKKTVEDDSFTKDIGNNRGLEARRIKKYCAKQEKCKDCIFFSPRGYLYDFPCSISEIRRPKNWDV